MTERATGRLAGKVAIVVGAGQTAGETIGNGRATAIRFAEEGARLLLVDRDVESLEATAAMVQERGGQSRVFAADVTVEADCAAMIEAASDAFGRIDVLHNNVGIGRGDRGPAHLTEEVWDRIMNTNTKSVSADSIPTTTHNKINNLLNYSITKSLVCHTFDTVW